MNEDRISDLELACARYAKSERWLSARVRELEDTLRDIISECRNNEDAESTRLESIRETAVAALVQE